MKPNKRTTVATLLATGTSQCTIARLTGVDRKAIRRLAWNCTGPEPDSPTPTTGLAAARYPTNRHLAGALEDWLAVRIERRWRMSDEPKSFAVCARTAP